MTSFILPVRKDIHNCLKNFPWDSEQQFEGIWAYLDHQLAGRGRGRQVLQRAGMVDFSDRVMGYWLDKSQFHLTKLNETLQ